MNVVTPKHTYRDLQANSPELSDTDVLNAGNPSKEVPTESDVTVVGAGIHGLIYALTTRLRHPEVPIKLTVFEKAARPQYKIGESTLPYFASWIDMIGLHPEYLVRIFGLHDGLEFYVLDRENQPDYKSFCNTGPPAFVNIAYQLQRAMSELLFTIYAQRNGIDVWHGHGADVQNTVLSAEGDTIPIKNSFDKSKTFVTKSPLLVDGTGRFRQYSSKAARVKRFDGFNTDAFWAYWVVNDEPGIAKELKGFEAGHTNHICIPEGWMYLIRMVSWDGSPLSGLIDMIHYILDHAKAGTRHDDIPSTSELAEMFGLKYKYIWSIGYALRNDTTYPADLEKYGSNEAERRFNFITQKYEKLRNVMSLFTRLDDHYGSEFEKWQIRKTLTYQTDVVSGPGWITVGDGIGFTNPLLSPGINAGLGSDVLAAELTADALAAKTEEERRVIWSRYDTYARNAVPSLALMNKFIYLTFKHPILAPRVSLLWTIMAGHAKQEWSLARRGFKVDIKEYAEYATHWLWGSQTADYINVANKTIELLEPLHVDERPTDEVVEQIIAHSESVLRAARAKGHYKGFPFRYAGWWRNFNAEQEWDDVKYEPMDHIAGQCHACDNWLATRGDWRKCSGCGAVRPEEDCQIKWNPPLDDEERMMWASIVPNDEALGMEHIAWLAKQKAMKEEMMAAEASESAANTTLPAAMSAATVSA